MLQKKIIFLLSVFFSVSCLSNTQNKENDNKQDTPTSGSIRIAVDESFMPLAEQEILAFTNQYANTKIQIIVAPEDKAIQLMLQDSVNAVIVSRELNTKERKEIERQKTVVQSWLQAYDALALILHPHHKDTNFSMETLKSIFAGNIKKWSDIQGSYPDKNITIILDNANSSNYNLANSKLEIADISKLKIYAAKSQLAVVEKVKKDSSCIGLVGYNWLSNDNSQTDSLLSKIKIARIDEQLPSQASFAEKKYPLTRSCYTLVKGGRIGLAYAFATFFNQEIGQRIVLKAGLLPYKIPPREIEIIK